MHGRILQGQRPETQTIVDPIRNRQAKLAVPIAHPATQVSAFNAQQRACVDKSLDKLIESLPIKLINPICFTDLSECQWRGHDDILVVVFHFPSRNFEPIPIGIGINNRIMACT